MRRFFDVFLWLGLTFSCSFFTCMGQQDSVIDDVGDIAFVGWSNSTQDGFAFVLLDACPDSSQIKFVDEEWVGSQFYSASGEGEVTWTNTSGNLLPKGTVVIVESANNNPTASVGDAVETDAGFDIASSQDQIFAIAGTRSSPKFLAMIGHTSLPSNGTGAVQTLSGTGLVVDSTAVHQTSEAIYVGSTTCNGSMSTCLATINDPNNWSKITTSNAFPSSVATSFSGSALPVKLLVFQAHLLESNRVELTWSTAMEVNNYGYEIQRLKGVNWKSIGFVEGNGNTNVTSKYRFIDILPTSLSADYFYRLVQTDFDGKTGIHPTIKLAVNGNETSVAFNYSTSFNQNHLVVNTYGEVVTDFAMSTLNGQKIVTIDQITGKYGINIDQLKPGIYIVTYACNGKRNCVKLVL